MNKIITETLNNMAVMTLFHQKNSHLVKLFNKKTEGLSLSLSILTLQLLCIHTLRRHNQYDQKPFVTSLSHFTKDLSTAELHENIQNCRKSAPPSLDAFFNGFLCKQKVSVEFEKMLIPGRLLMEVGQLASDDGLTPGSLHQFFLQHTLEIDSQMRAAKWIKISGNNRKMSGAYFTPTWVVDHLTEEVLSGFYNYSNDTNYTNDIRKKVTHNPPLSNLKFLDPSCGSGDFLEGVIRKLESTYSQGSETGQNKRCQKIDNGTQPPRQNFDTKCGGANSPARFIVQNLFGVDINPLAVALCQFNLCLLLPQTVSSKSLLKNIRQGDSLFDSDLPKADIVIGNPPYGALLTGKKRERAGKLYPNAHSAHNIAALFIERFLPVIDSGGALGFVLPKSLTYSFAWRKIRQILLNSLFSVIDVGRAWREVMLEQILLVSRKCDGHKPTTTFGSLNNKSMSRTIPSKISTIEKMDIFPSSMSQEEAKLVDFIQQTCKQNFTSYVSTCRGYALPAVDKTVSGKIPLLRGRDIHRFEQPVAAIFVRDGVATEGLRICKPSQVLFQNIITVLKKPQPHLFLIGTVIDSIGSQVACLDTINLLTLKKRDITPYALCALLLSNFINWYLFVAIYNKASLTMHFDGYFLKKIPLPAKFDFSNLDKIGRSLKKNPGQKRLWVALNKEVNCLYALPDTLPSSLMT